MRVSAATAGAILSLVLTCVPVGAQWFTQPSPRVPRTADGKPDLAAPVVRTADQRPDLSGMWRLAAPTHPAQLLERASLQPWAVAARDKFIHELGRDDTFVRCLPAGPRRMMAADLVKFVQSPDVIVMLYEDMTYRQVFLDGRALPRDPNPSWMGYSVGRWEGDTLIVDSVGFNAGSYLTSRGNPHTEALRVTERFRRTQIGRMEVEVTLEDPQTFTGRVVVPVTATFVPDTDLIEYVCNENERSRQHLVGTADDDKKLAVSVAPEVLARYAGTYRMEDARRDVLTVTLRDTQLFFRRGTANEVALIPLADTRFSAAGTPIEFVVGAQGHVSHILLRLVEEDVKASRMDSSPR